MVFETKIMLMCCLKTRLIGELLANCWLVACEYPECSWLHSCSNLFSWVVRVHVFVYCQSMCHLRLKKYKVLHKKKKKHAGNKKHESSDRGSDLWTVHLNRKKKKKKNSIIITNINLQLQHICALQGDRELLSIKLVLARFYGWSLVVAQNSKNELLLLSNVIFNSWAVPYSQSLTRHSNSWPARKSALSYYSWFAEIHGFIAQH